MPNNGNGNPSLKVRLLTSSRRMNGSVSRRLMSAGALMVERVFCMMSPINGFDQHYNLLVEVVEMAGIDTLFPGFRRGADYLLK